MLITWNITFTQMREPYVARKLIHKRGIIYWIVYRLAPTPSTPDKWVCQLSQRAFSLLSCDWGLLLSLRISCSWTKLRILSSRFMWICAILCHRFSGCVPYPWNITYFTVGNVLLEGVRRELRPQREVPCHGGLTISALIDRRRSKIRE